MRVMLAKFVSQHPTLTLFILVAIGFAITFTFSRRFRESVYDKINRLIEAIGRLIAFAFKVVVVSVAVLVSVSIIYVGTLIFDKPSSADAGDRITLCKENASCNNTTTINGPMPTQ